MITTGRRQVAPRIAIIQARMTSTRLPGKVLADIAGKPALQHMLERVAKARRVDDIVVATTVNASDDPVAALCDGLGVRHFRGDERDVLGRYRDAAAAASARTVIRLTADCPMTDPSIVDEAIRAFELGDWDYVSNVRPRTYPDGLDVEVFSRDALEKAAVAVAQAELREHVTLYINGNRPHLGKGDFKLGSITLPGDFSHIRWTVDTSEDLARIRQLMAALPEGFGWMEALAEASRNPSLLGLPCDSHTADNT